MKRIAIVIWAMYGCSSEPILADDIEGHWTGDWGQLVLRVVGNEIRGTYSHDQGTVVGTFSAGTFKGWWCEVPSRKPTGDAGEVEFEFARSGESLDLDGRWRYGAEGEWREDWDLVHSKMEAPQDLKARFDEASAFCRSP